MFSDTPYQGLATDVQQLDEKGDIKVDPGPVSSVVLVVNNGNNPAVASVVVNPICSASPPSSSGPRDQPVKDCLEMKDIMSSLVHDVCEANMVALQEDGGPSSTPRKGKRRFRENKDGLYSDRMEPERSKHIKRSLENQEGLLSYHKYKEMFNKNLEVFHANIEHPKRSRKKQEDLCFYLSRSRKRKREDVKTPQTFTYSKRSKD
ncbi:hypothetical protein DPEC_G00021830 [Dallia pectoralis]|uniref:Uncharacterized protein n=1 Tax=Dallia pectoralis TaxID=75939 RepID=A0ACC2HGR7_DALPE|nr:hypothetical protein DPEC_G00021830 [Dallia pectoralis]